MTAHAGCNWEGCAVCFPHLKGKLPVSDSEQFDRALAVANGAYLRNTERLDPIAVARHAARMLKLKMEKATGKVYAKYIVWYCVTTDTTQRQRTNDVILIRDYTTFADIPKILSVMAECEPEEIDIIECYAINHKA